MRIRPLPPLAYLEECFQLDSSCESGLRWKRRPKRHLGAATARWNARYAGRSAGSVWTSPRNGRQYFKVAVDDNKFFVHRIIFSLFNLEELETSTQIDHIDNNSLNNHIGNLRKATHSNNAANVSLRSDNSSGIKGVSWSKSRRKWHAYAKVGNVRHQNFFVNIRDAEDYVNKLRDQLHREFARHV